MAIDEVLWENSLARSAEQKPEEKWMEKKRFYIGANYLLQTIPWI